MVKEKRVKIRMLSLVTLALAVLLAVPAHAQQRVTIQFRLTVNVACPNATYYGLVGVPNSEGFEYTQLTDPDGDGVFTGTGSAATNEPIPVLRLIQGTGTQVIEPPGSLPTQVPGDPSRIVRDFGTPTLTEDTVLEGGVSDCIGAGLPSTGVSDTVPMSALLSGMLLVIVGIALRQRVALSA